MTRITLNPLIVNNFNKMSSLVLPFDFLAFS
jgi:hypothetical protein